MSKVRILIVEDDPIIAADLGWQLEDLKMEVVETFEAGEEAFSFFQKKGASPVDLVLMDVKLAGTWDGIETASQIQALDPVPIIYLTSNSDPATLRQAKRTRPAAFLAKPFRTVDLRNAIELAIANAGAARPNPGPEPRSDDTPIALQSAIFVKDKDVLQKIQLADIQYAEAYDYYCKVHLPDRSYLLTYTLKKLEERLPAEYFLRIHRSYLINLGAIDAVGDVFVQLGPHQIPIGKSYRQALRDRIQLL